MSVEKIVEQRVQKFKNNQERLIKEDKAHESKGLFGGILNGTNYGNWRKENEVFANGYARGLEDLELKEYNNTHNK